MHKKYQRLFLYFSSKNSTALRAVPDMGDYGGSAPVIPHIRRMRSIRTPVVDKKFTLPLPGVRGLS
ncbi:MAG: hypothetical protein CVV49_06560 [Spirochaetae bacterium HGW-Spirochaetae-5]|nr:MAG: hypothetical protein CVV49_06560 [Spirochaetae bacterium HGW-Spirochaetae-5]